MRPETMCSRPISKARICCLDAMFVDVLEESHFNTSLAANTLGILKFNVSPAS